MIMSHLRAPTVPSLTRAGLYINQVVPVEVTPLPCSWINVNKTPPGKIPWTSSPDWKVPYDRLIKTLIDSNPSTRIRDFFEYQRGLPPRTHSDEFVHKKYPNAYYI